MLLTDVRDEIMGIKAVEGLSWQDLGDRLGVNRQSVRDGVNVKNFIPKSTIALMEAMGYDIEINFIRREKEERAFL